MKTRCKWAGDDLLYIRYHDTEWGVPVHDDRKLFEFLILEGAQAGLSWITILKKRENYRNAYDNFNPRKMAEYNADKIKDLLTNKGIVRNRLKIESAIQNARSFLTVQKEFGSFDTYIWQFAGDSKHFGRGCKPRPPEKPIKNRWKTQEEIPSKTKESVAMSNDLKKEDLNLQARHSVMRLCKLWAW